MSGDIGDGTTLAAVKLGQKVLAAGLPGYVQLAGGTNSYTVPKLQAMGLLKGKRHEVRGTRYEGATARLEIRGTKQEESNLSPLASYLSPTIAGVAYGSYARVLLAPILNQLEQMEVRANETSTVRLEEKPELLWQAVALAHSLVSQLKS